MYRLKTWDARQALPKVAFESMNLDDRQIHRRHSFINSNACEDSAHNDVSLRSSASDISISDTPVSEMNMDIVSAISIEGLVILTCYNFRL